MLTYPSQQKSIDTSALILISIIIIVNSIKVFSCPQEVFSGLSLIFISTAGFLWLSGRGAIIGQPTYL